MYLHNSLTFRGIGLSKVNGVTVARERRQRLDDQLRRQREREARRPMTRQEFRERAMRDLDLRW